MDKFIKIIGSLVIAVALIGVPILTGVSFALGWHGLIRVSLALFTIVLTLLLFFMLFDEVSE